MIVLGLSLLPSLAYGSDYCTKEQYEHGLGMDARHNGPKASLNEPDGLVRKALQLEPQLARAYVGLGEVYTYLIDLGLAPSGEEALAKKMEAAKKAVTLDPNDGKTHLALGEAYSFHGKAE